MSFCIGNRAANWPRQAPTPQHRLLFAEARWQESGGGRVSLGAFPDGQSCLNLATVRLRHFISTQGAVPEEKVRKIPDATYEISTDEYLSVVRCAILGRIGSHRYRSEAFFVPSYRDGIRA